MFTIRRSAHETPGILANVPIMLDTRVRMMVDYLAWEPMKGVASNDTRRLGACSR